MNSDVHAIIAPSNQTTWWHIFVTVAQCIMEILTFVRTLRYAMIEKIVFQMPISDAFFAIGRRHFMRNFHASKRSSIILFNNANNGANLQQKISIEQKELIVNEELEFTEKRRQKVSRSRIG